MGGTFDHLHIGHRYLLETALSVSQEVHIGLTGDALLKNKKFSEKLENYKTRKKNLEDFITSFADLNRIKIMEINEPFGPVITDPRYEGQIVSQETYPNAVKMSEIREENGLKPLIIIVIPILKNENNEKISSTLIREKLK